MSKKKKVSNSIKDKRRLHEAEKASMKSRLTASFSPVSPEANVKRDVPVGEKFNLPVAHIKRDMVKNGLYMVFVVVVLAVLKMTGFKF
jgi:hypothetical protein